MSSTPPLTCHRIGERVGLNPSAAARTPRAAAAGAQIVFSCVGNDDDLRSVFLVSRAFVPASLPGHARRRVKGASYPIVVRDPRSEVAGAVVGGKKSPNVRPASDECKA